MSKVKERLLESWEEVQPDSDCAAQGHTARFPAALRKDVREPGCTESYFIFADNGMMFGSAASWPSGSGVPGAEANAAELVRRWNAYPELLAALEACAEVLGKSYIAQTGVAGNEAYWQARAAVARARGEVRE